MEKREPNDRLRRRSQDRPTTNSFSSPAAVLTLTLAMSLASASAAAQSASGTPADNVELPTIIVTGATEARRELQTPAAVGVIDASRLQGARPQINLAETLNSVPGVDVRDRQNSAQDLQIQIRGYGARSTFGVRGIHLRADGVPLSAPDGQGQVSNLLIGSLDRIEILRGPLAYQYGNSAGGVIAAYSATPPDALGVEASFSAGSYDSWREALAVGGRSEDRRLGYRVDVERYDSEGFRDHSQARRNLASMNLRYDLGGGQQLRLLAGGLWGAHAQDPLGLTRAQFEQDPEQAAAVATTFDTRKSSQDWRTALGYSGPWSSRADWDLIVYGSGRDIEQFLSIPKAAQASPARAGGVVDLARSGYGLDARTTHRFEHWSLSAGVQYQTADEHRRGYENFVGDTLGVKGALRRDEDNRLDNFDQYIFAEYPFADRWMLSGALRHSEVDFESDDRYVRAGNPDDSGRTGFSATLPAASLSFAPDASQLLYLSAGAGFETPTFNELSYRSDGEGGLNLALDAAHSRSIELGWKRGLGDKGLLTLALFHIDTDDEIVPAATIDGRASFQNAGSTRRRGVELGVALPLPGSLRLQVAANHLDAQLTQSYSYSNGGNVVTVPDGKPIPGVARNSVYTELGWRRGRPGWSSALELRYSDRIPVDDLDSDAAPSYTVANASLAYRWATPRRDIETFLRVFNLFDEHYAGSVIVNDSNGRYFEPAPGRGFHLGASMRWGG